MANVKPSYAIMNIAYRDKSRENDYLLSRVYGKAKFFLPVNMPESQFMFPSEPTEFVHKDFLKERELDQYTQEEFENKLQDFTIEVNQHIEDNIDTVHPETDHVDESYPINAERLILNIIPVK